jgi:hypothetical protein
VAYILKEVRARVLSRGNFKNLTKHLSLVYSWKFSHCYKAGCFSLWFLVVGAC